MPTYVVTAPQGRLSQAQKTSLGQAITGVHCEVTGAPSYFVQVIFQDVADGNYFVGGKPLDTPDHVYVHGTIRAGRDEATKARIMQGIVNSLVEHAAVPADCVQVYIADIPARQVLEFGQLLPLPGEEQAWWDGLTPALQARLKALQA